MKVKHESLKEWQESHQTSNPRLAKKHGIKLISPAKKSLEKAKGENRATGGGFRHGKWEDTKASNPK